MGIFPMNLTKQNIKMKDLYDILGIKKNASPEDVKKAYRKTSKKTHPDKGGSNEEFQETKKAYEVLSNTKLRDRYDETGEVEDDTSSKHSAMQDVAQIFEMVLTKYEGEIEYTDIICEMLKVFEDGLQSTKQSIKEWKAQIPHHEKISSRIKTDEGDENIFKSFIDGKIAVLNNSIRSAEEQINRIEESISMVEIYSCEIKIKEEPDYSNFGRRAQDRRSNQFQGTWY